MCLCCKHFGGCSLVSARLSTRWQGRRLRSRRLAMRSTTTSTPSGRWGKSSCCATWTMRTYVRVMLFTSASGHFWNSGSVILGLGACPRLFVQNLPSYRHYVCVCFRLSSKQAYHCTSPFNCKDLWCQFAKNSCNMECLLLLLIKEAQLLQHPVAIIGCRTALHLHDFHGWHIKWSGDVGLN